MFEFSVSKDMKKEKGKEKKKSMNKGEFQHIF